MLSSALECPCFPLLELTGLKAAQVLGEINRGSSVANSAKKLLVHKEVYCRLEIR